jgi:hypothetical protein
MRWSDSSVVPTPTPDAVRHWLFRGTLIVLTLGSVLAPDAVPNGGSSLLCAGSPGPHSPQSPPAGSVKMTRSGSTGAPRWMSPTLVNVISRPGFGATRSMPIGLISVDGVELDGAVVEVGGGLDVGGGFGRWCRFLLAWAIHEPILLDGHVLAAVQVDALANPYRRLRRGHTEAHLREGESIGFAHTSKGLVLITRPLSSGSSSEQPATTNAATTTMRRTECTARRNAPPPPEARGGPTAERSAPGRQRLPCRRVGATTYG